MHLDHAVEGDDLPISVVSELLAVPIPTIHSWERRFSLPRPGRTPGGHRRYSQDDLRLLRSIRDEIARGHAASEAIETVLRTAPRADHIPAIAAFLAAVDREDPDTMRATLDEALARFGLAETLQRVLFPAMRDIGWRWMVGRCDVGREHLATDTARAWLARFRSRPVREGRTGDWIVLACGPADHHTVGLESFAALLTDRGWRCHVLGARTPIASLLRASAQERTRGIVVVSHLATGRRAAVDALRALADAVEVPFFYAGNAFARARVRRSVPGRFLGEDLLDAVEALAVAVRDPQAVGR